MSVVAWVVSAAVLIPIAAGLVAGVIVKPHGPWIEVFLTAAYATGAVVGPLAVSAIALMLAHPSNEHGDQAAAVQLVFIGVLAIPLFIPALAGAAIGKLLGRRLRRTDHRDADRREGGTSS
jgi:MFS family permease